MSHPGEAMAELPLSKLLQLTGFQTLLFIAIGLGMWAFTGRAVADFVTVDAIQIGQGFGIAAGMIALGYVLFRGFPRFGEKLVRDQVQQFAFLRNPLGPAAIVFIAACAGIGEEALFRGGMLVLINHYTPLPLALVVSAGVFTVIHFAKPAVASLIFAIGLFFGLVYWSTGSLLAVMIAHWVYDIWALWFIQKEMHRLGVFDEAPPPETGAELATTGENQ